MAYKKSESIRVKVRLYGGLHRPIASAKGQEIELALIEGATALDVVKKLDLGDELLLVAVDGSLAEDPARIQVKDGSVVKIFPPVEGGDLW